MLLLSLNLKIICASGRLQSSFLEASAIAEISVAKLLFDFPKRQERQRETTIRQTDTQTHTQTHTHIRTYTHTYIQIDTHTHRKRHRQTNKQSVKKQVTARVRKREKEIVRERESVTEREEGERKIVVSYSSFMCFFMLSCLVSCYFILYHFILSCLILSRLECFKFFSYEAQVENLGSRSTIDGAGWHTDGLRQGKAHPFRSDKMIWVYNF